MTPSDPRVGEIQARLNGATPGRWYVEGEPDEAKSVVQYTSANGISVGTYIVDVNERDEDAEFIANAPADVAYLLAQLRARDARIAAVEALHVMEYIEDEDYSRNRCAECLYEADDREDCPTIEAIRAAVAAAKGGGE